MPPARHEGAAVSRILALVVAWASWGFLTLSAVLVAAFDGWPIGAGLVIVAFGAALDVITFRAYRQTQLALLARRRPASFNANRPAEAGIVFYMIALFFVLAFIQGADEPVYGIDLRLLASLALMAALFLSRLFIAAKRAGAADRRFDPDDVEPLPDLLAETSWGMLALLLLFPLMILPARLQRAVLNLIGYGLGLGVVQAAFLLIADGVPGLATIGLLLAFPAAIFFCAFLIPIFARSPLLARP